MKKWRSADGKYHDVKDMSTAYIRRCLKKIQYDLRYSEYIDPPDDINLPVIVSIVNDPEEWIERFNKELERRDNKNWNDLDCTMDWLKRKNKYVKNLQAG